MSGCRAKQQVTAPGNPSVLQQVAQQHRHLGQQNGELLQYVAVQLLLGEFPEWPSAGQPLPASKGQPSSGQYGAVNTGHSRADLNVAAVMLVLAASLVLKNTFSCRVRRISRRFGLHSVLPGDFRCEATVELLYIVKPCVAIPVVALYMVYLQLLQCTRYSHTSHNCTWCSCNCTLCCCTNGTFLCDATPKMVVLYMVYSQVYLV